MPGALYFQSIIVCWRDPALLSREVCIGPKAQLCVKDRSIIYMDSFLSQPIYISIQQFKDGQADESKKRSKFCHKRIDNFVFI